MVKRNYKWVVYQISGSPYGNDYPNIEINPDKTRQDLMRIRERGLGTIVAFDDTQGTDCSYLIPTAEKTQDLVNCVMGIFESNGVFDNDVQAVASVLKQQHELWPNAINAFHSTPQNNNAPGFGERPFWDEVAPYTDVYFLQQRAWDRPLPDVADRAQDFTERLQNGVAGWPILNNGVVLFEETTTATYHLGWTEKQAITTMDRLLGMINPRPTGFMDNGTP